MKCFQWEKIERESWEDFVAMYSKLSIRSFDCSRGKIGARSPAIGRQATFFRDVSANYQSIEAKYEALDSCNQFLKEEVNNHQDLVS